MARFEEITEASLAAQVRAFYGEARKDPVLGPVFEAAVADWEAHFETLTRFWASVMLGVRSYRGDPMAAHKAHAIEPGFFDRWLALWGRTADALFAPGPAAALKERAAMIGRSLKLALFFRPDDLAPAND
jgi:hemoglobin